MITSTVTITSPTGASVVLGARTYDGAGNFVGYSLNSFTVDPAPLTAYTKNLPLVSGGVVVAGHAGIRRIEIEGSIFATDADGANALRASLMNVLRDADGELVTVTWTVASIARSLSAALDGSVEFSVEDGPVMAYKMSLVCPDPVAYAAATSSTATSYAVNTTTVTNTGDATVWPLLTVDFSGSCSSLRIGNSTAGRYLELSDLGAVAGSQLVIDTRPGYEIVELNSASVLSKLTAASRFWPLQPGANSVYVSNLSPGGANVRVTVSWRNGWVS